MTSEKKESHRRHRRHRPDNKPIKKKQRRRRKSKLTDLSKAQTPNDQLAPIDRFHRVFNRLYGSEYRAAKKMLHPKLQQKRMGTRSGPTLYERILQFRKLRGEDGEIPGEQNKEFDDVNENKVPYKSESRPDDTPVASRAQTEATPIIRKQTYNSPQLARARKQAYEESKGRSSVYHRSDSSFASVDIADFASLEEDHKRSPSPQPTFTKRIAGSHTPPQRRSAKVVHEDRSFKREVPENATPRQVFVEMDSPEDQQYPKVIDDSHRTVWEVEEDDSRPPSQAATRKETVTEKKNVTVIQERKHTATPRSKSSTPKRTPTPKQSPSPTLRRSPSDLNPHTVLPPITHETTKTETRVEKTIERQDSTQLLEEHFEKEEKTVVHSVEDSAKAENNYESKTEQVEKKETVERSDSRHSITEKHVEKEEKTSEVIQKTEEKSVKSEEKSVKSEEKSVKSEEKSVKSEEKQSTETSEENTVEETDERVEETKTSKKEEKVEEKRSTKEETQKTESTEEVEEKKESKQETKTEKQETKESAKSSQSQESEKSSKEEQKEESEESSKDEQKEEETSDTDETAVIAAAVGAPAVVAATAAGVAAASNKSKPTERKPEKKEAEKPGPSQPKSNEPKPEQKNNKPKPKAKPVPQMDDKERADAIEQLDKLADHKIKSLIDPGKAGEEPVVDPKIREKVFSKEFQDDLDKFLNSP